MNRSTKRDLTDLRAYRRRRNPGAAEQRPTRAEAAADRQATDYRMRTYLLRAGTPPTPDYREARARLDAARAAAKESRP